MKYTGRYQSDFNVKGYWVCPRTAGVARRLRLDADNELAHGLEPRHCPGRKPPYLAFKRPARPYKSPIQNLFT